MTTPLAAKPPLKYVRIADDLRGQIVRGRFEPGQKLHTERQLAAMFKTTQMTVRQAMDSLAREGLVERVQGSGTYVAQPRPPAAAVVFDQLVLDSGATPYWLGLLTGLQELLSERGWDCKYFLNVTGTATSEAFEQALGTHRFDAAVLTSRWAAEQELGALTDAGIHCVGIFPFSGLDYWVSFDGAELGRLGVLALAEAGRKRIALIRGPIDFPGLGDPVQGYRAGLQECGLSTTGNVTYAHAVSDEAGYRSFQDLRSSVSQPDGLIVTDELIMRGVVRAMVECGLGSCDDLRVASQVSCEGIENPFSVPVIQLRSPVRKQAETVTQMLVDLTAGREVKEPEVLIAPVA